MTTRSSLLIPALLLGVLVYVGGPASGVPAVAAVPSSVRSVSAPVCTLERPRLIDESYPNVPLSRLAARSLWQHATGKGVVVAVVDSGVESDNAHFPGEAVLPGYSNVPGHSDPHDSFTPHGTAVAGLIAARKIDGSAVVGLAPDAKILPVRVFVAEDEEYVQSGMGPRVDRMADGIRWAASNGADVISVSMSSLASSGDIREAVAYAGRRDALVVASAGNNESGKPSQAWHPVWPAAVPGVLGVTAANDAGQVTSYAVHGSHVDLVAPGTNVLTPFFDAGDCAYQAKEGDQPLTSLATPLVAASAALLMEQHPNESPAEIAYRLNATADRPLRDTRDRTRGWGFVRPLEALTMTIDPNRSGPPVPGEGRGDGGTGDVRVPRLTVEHAPLAPARASAVWWLTSGAGVLVLVLVITRWRALTSPRQPRRRRRSQERARRDGGRGWADAPNTARPAGPRP